MGIYSYELFNFYNVQNIIRIGSAGAISSSLKVRDVVAGMSACTNSNYASQYNLPGTFAPTANYELLSCATSVASDLGVDIKVGSLLSSDTFYDDSSSLIDWQKWECLPLKWSCVPIYERFKGRENALAICTISDCPFTGESCSSQERETSFTQMMEIALKLLYYLRNRCCYDKRIF